MWSRVHKVVENFVENYASKKNKKRPLPKLKKFLSFVSRSKACEEINLGNKQSSTTQDPVQGTVQLNKAEILTEISNRLPEDFDTLDQPEHKLHFLVKATNEVLEELCGLQGEFVLVDGSKTLVELLTPET